MKELQLILKTKWFEMTKAGIKKEDYRDLSPYWFCRLVLIDGKQKSQKWWEENYLLFFPNAYLNKLFASENYKWSMNNFEVNKMTLGYPQSTDADKILNIEHKGIEIREGNPDWGAEKGVSYFVIIHGEIL